MISPSLQSFTSFADFQACSFVLVQGAKNNNRPNTTMFMALNLLKVDRQNIDAS